MPRPLRLQFENAWYHTMNRGAGRKTIFHTNEEKFAFLDLLSEAHELFDAQIHAYCLMDNHYHLLIKTPLPNLSKIMRHINGSYTMYFNKRHGTDGALFRGRYKAQVVDSHHYLLKVSRYIHLNPISANITQNLNNYPWSSYTAYTNTTKKPRWLYTDQILFLLNEHGYNFHQYLEEGLDPETRNFFSKAKTPVIFGREEFKKQLLDKLSHKKIAASRPDFNTTYSTPSIDEINSLCANYFKVDKQKLRERHNKTIERKISIYVCRVFGKENLSNIANYYTLKSPSSITNLIDYVRIKLKTDKKLKEFILYLEKKWKMKT